MRYYLGRLVAALFARIDRQPCCCPFCEGIFEGGD